MGSFKPVSKREIYKGVAEVSVYMDKQFTNKRFGTVLLIE